MVNVGVIGAGIMGADHVNTLHRQISGATVTMVADVDIARASAAAADAGARVTGDPLALIADPQVEAVVIVSPDPTHPDLAIAAIAAGKPVMCEKPLAPTVADCRRIAAAERAAVTDGAPLISVGFMRRFDPAYLELKAGLRSGACGAPLLMHCVSRGVSSGPGATNESSITNSAIHEFDAVPWLLDAPIVEVSWQAGRSSPAVPGLHDPQLILLRTADATLTTVELFLNARYGYDIRCEVVGEHGVIALAPSGHVVSDVDRARSTRHDADWRPRFADAYRLELQAWVDAVAAGSPSPLPTAHDSVVVAGVAGAVITSMHEGGRWVRVDAPATEPAQR